MKKEIFIKLSLSCLILFMIVFQGCSKETISSNIVQGYNRSQNIIVFVEDKQSKSPIENAKVYIYGDSNPYITDKYGKTTEIKITLDKGYFKKYNYDLQKKVGCGFIDIVVVKNGYGKQMEIDYSVYPGTSPYLVKIDLEKGNKIKCNVNSPEKRYVEDLINVYENINSSELKSNNAVKYKIEVLDKDDKPIKEAKIVVPESNLVAKTDSSGKAIMELSYDVYEDNDTISKEYGEATFLIYKADYIKLAILKVPIYKETSRNELIVRLDKSKKKIYKCIVTKPNINWFNKVINSYEK